MENLALIYDPQGYTLYIQNVWRQMLFISPKVRQKLIDKHSVTQPEIEQCFANREGNFLLDEREEHQSDPPTKWFIAQTDYGRKLKIVLFKWIADV